VSGHDGVAPAGCFLDVVAAGAGAGAVGEGGGARTPSRSNGSPCCRRRRHQSPTNSASRAGRSRDDRAARGPGRATRPSGAPRAPAGFSLGRSPALPPPRSQMWHSRTGPIAPAPISSTICRSSPCVDLRAHLRGDVGLLRCLHDRATFEDVARDRLFAIHVLLRPQRGQGGEGVRVLGGRDEEGVDVVHPRVQFAEVFVGPRLREQRGGAVEGLRVHVAQGNQLHQVRHLLRLVHVRSAATARGDAGHVHLRVRRLRRDDPRKSDNGGSGGHEGSLEEATALRRLIDDFQMTHQEAADAVAGGLSEGPGKGDRSVPIRRPAYSESQERPDILDSRTGPSL